MSVHVNAEYAHEMTARERLRSILVERMYQQVVARPAYPKVYSMGLSIIKTQVQNMHEKKQKRKLKPRMEAYSKFYTNQIISLDAQLIPAYSLNTTIYPQVLLPD